jgi:molybdopterin converting factor small subunit
MSTQDKRPQAAESKDRIDRRGGGMRVTVRLFATLRERAGATLDLELGSGARVSDALRTLSEREQLRGVLERLPVAVAVNHQYAKRATELHDGDELALIPPLSGG